MESSRDIIIQTDKFAEAVRFYKNYCAFQLRTRAKNSWDSKRDRSVCTSSRGSLHGPVLEFYVADVEAAKKELFPAGCRVEQEDPSVPRCYLRDPFGLTFNLSS